MTGQDKNSEEQLMKCEKERNEYLNGWKRAQADFINYKNEETKRMEEILKFGQENILMEIISIADSFDLAVASLEKSEQKTDGLAQGLSMIKLQIEELLKRNGIEKISANTGESFNPAVHEAVFAEKSDKPAGIIIEEVEKGYILNKKVIKPAKVKVSK